MKLKLAVLTLVGSSSLCSLGVSAEDLRHEILSCAAQSSYVARLDCYDSLARGLQSTMGQEPATVPVTGGDGPVTVATGSVTATAAAVAASPKTEKVAAWNLMHDDKAVSFMTPDTPMTLGGAGLAKLTIRCEQQKPAELAIDWGFELNSDVYLSVSTDQGGAQRISARSSPNGEITYYTRPVKPLLQSMLSASYLEVFADDGRRLLRARFMMKDLDKAISPYRQQCGLE